MRLGERGARNVTECNPQTDLFSIGRRKVTMIGNGQFLTSNAGVLLAARTEQKLGISERLARHLRDHRNPLYVRHTFEDQIRQRVLQIACGYEDGNDAKELREEPAFLTAMGRVAGSEDRLASQPTLSRFEQRESVEVMRLSLELVDVWIDRLLARGPKAWRNIILDFDGTDDPTHGAQQLSMFHGYYDQHMYHPLVVFDREGWPVAVVLRPGNAGAATGAASVLVRIFRRIVERLPRGAKITFRADAGFALPEIYDLCRVMGIRYITGQNSFPVFKERVAGLIEAARAEFAKTGERVRWFTEFHHQAGTWSVAQRIIAKVEISTEGENVRFITTDRDEQDPEQNYDFYADRGQSENWIKDLKNAMFADRLSCSSFHANQFRLLLHTAAYMVLYELREIAAGTDLARVQMDTLRLKLLKLGACIVVTARRIWVRLSQHDPRRAVFEIIARRLTPSPLT
jgi:hypothetical protein